LTDGGTTIHVAAQNGQDSIIAQLIACKRCDVNAAGLTDGRTAIHVAAVSGHGSIIAQFIACERCDVNATLTDGQTAIHLAAYKGHVSIIAQFIACERFDVNAAFSDGRTAIHFAASACHASIIDILAEAGAILSSHDSPNSLLSIANGAASTASPEQKDAVRAILKKHGINDIISPGFQSRYYFNDGKGELYLKNVKYQRWINRKELLLALYRVCKWSLANQVEAEVCRTLPRALTGVGTFICRCWFDCAGGGNDINAAADTLGNGIGRLIMQFYGGFDASKSPFALRGKPEYGKCPDNAARCSGCLEKKESKSLRACASCGVVRYCGKDCQRTDWKRHKKSCAKEKKK
jgi:hypothetical protein